MSRLFRVPSALRPRLVLGVLALVVLLSPQDEHGKDLGTSFQIALPLLAWGCEATNGSGPEYLLRYVVMFTTLHGTRRALGETDINARPNGGWHGFPSGHTATAVFGASSLVQSCLTGHPVVQGVVLLAAAFTGTSRVTSGWHDIWQVLAGALLGWGCDRAFRRPGPVRRGIGAGFAAIGRLFRR